MFEFGDVENLDCSMKISNYDKEKLKNAPVSNLSAERTVGAINYELKIRGNKELKAASSAHVKSKAANLIQGQAMDKKFETMTKKDGTFSSILRKWEENQNLLRQKV